MLTLRIRLTTPFAPPAAAVPAPTYQWYFNDAPFAGATASTLSFSSPRAADAGDYNVVIKNALGSTTSNKAKLTVSAPEGPSLQMKED